MGGNTPSKHKNQDLYVNYYDEEYKDIACAHCEYKTIDGSELRITYRISPNNIGITCNILQFWLSTIYSLKAYFQSKEFQFPSSPCIPPQTLVLF